MRVIRGGCSSNTQDPREIERTPIESIDLVKLETFFRFLGR